MDTGKGTFEQLDTEGMTDTEIIRAKARAEHKHKQHGGWFREGEELEIRGSRFRIQSVKPKGLRLKLLKRKL
ncbi:hypothetical protein LCGC14_2508500 [marine sediment metagenome]|uniref:Uncharacterized protein n=1 Tax=marine sediment metagenome TaxID=412755 RepID=A0A0F9B0G8_9ZZZZ